MIRNLDIGHFRGLHGVAVHEMEPFTLIVGKNNSGKSTVLESVFFLFDFLSPDVFMRVNDFRGKRQVNGAGDLWGGLIDSSFPIPAEEERRYGIAVAAEGTFGVVELECELTAGAAAALSGNAVLGGANGTLSNGAADCLSYSLRSDAFLDRGTYCMRGDVVRRESDGPRSAGALKTPRACYVPPCRENQAGLTGAWGDALLRNDAGRIVELLRVIDPGITGVEAVPRPAGTELYVRAGSAFRPLAFAGEGMRSALVMLLYTLSVDHGVILIDEIENGLHHSVYKDVCRLLASAARERSNQIIAASQSFEFTAACTEALLETEWKDDFCLYRLTRDSSRALAIRYAPSELETAAEFNLEIR